MMYSRRAFVGAAAGALATACTPAGTALPLTIAVPMTSDNQEVQQELARRFMIHHPHVAVTLDTSNTGYDDLVQKTLRAALSGTQPDAGYYPYNRIRTLVERKLPIAIDTKIAAEPHWDELGYIPATLGFAAVGARTYGLPFNTSGTIVYYNADLVRAAGGDPDALPVGWEQIVELARRIHRLANRPLGIYYDYYDTAGNITFMALVESFCGSMMSPDESQITFDQPPGRRALEVLRDIGASGFTDMSKSQARQAFAAGGLGIMVLSGSYLRNLAEAAKGRFDLRVGQFPMPCHEGRMPAGGNAIVLLTKDPAKQHAAWEWMKFVTGPIGQGISVRNSGYIATNRLTQTDAGPLAQLSGAHGRDMNSLQLLPRLHAWYAFPGRNSMKISDVIRERLREVITLRRAPDAVMDDMVRDVAALLPEQHAATTQVLPQSGR